MKITDVRVRYYEYTLARPVGDANFPTGNDQASAAFTFVDTDEGITGIAPGAGAARRAGAGLYTVPLGDAQRAKIR